MSEAEPGAAADEAAAPGDAAAAPEPDAAAPPMTVEDLIETLEQTTTQRDEYLATAQRL